MRLMQHEGSDNSQWKRSVQGRHKNEHGGKRQAELCVEIGWFFMNELLWVRHVTLDGRRNAYAGQLSPTAPQYKSKQEKKKSITNMALVKRNEINI